MSIEKIDYSQHLLVCDICDDAIAFDDFNDAVEYKKAKGWVSREDSGGWYDICPDCEEKVR